MKGVLRFFHSSKENSSGLHVCNLGSVASHDYRAFVK